MAKRSQDEHAGPSPRPPSSIKGEKTPPKGTLFGARALFL